MKTSSVTVPNLFALAEWVPRKERFELSLIFMVAAAAGNVVLSSRGLTTTADVFVPMANGFMFFLLWVLPRLNLRNAIRTLILGIAWVFLSNVICHQIASVMTSPISLIDYQEAYPQ